MRIATSELYTSSLATMENQQAQLLQIEQQISSGNSLTNPADNPVAAAQAVTLSSTSATLTQYATNQTSGLSTLQLEDSTLTSVTSTLQAINGLIQEAQSGTVNDTNRASIAQEIQGYRNQLLSLANTTDGSGNALFAGFANTTQAFTDTPGVGVQYNGDSGQRLVQVSATRQVSVADTGQAVFMSVQAMGTQPVPAGSSTNVGTGTIGAVTVTNPSATTNNDNYSIAFSSASGTLSYTVTDNSTVPPTVGPVTPYTDGASIALGNGLTTTISGTPDGGTAPAFTGDTFTVTPATAPANTNIFSTIDNVIAALNTPAQASTSAMANVTNALTTGMAALSNSLSNVITVQASVGGREQELTALQSITSTNALQTTTNLSNLTSTNMTAAITQYTQLETALQASQSTFAKTQSLSLFNYINN
jgi:flagellar hook-associated protein 3 FlgL